MELTQPLYDDPCHPPAIRIARVWVAFLAVASVVLFTTGGWWASVGVFCLGTAVALGTVIVRCRRGDDINM